MKKLLKRALYLLTCLSMVCTTCAAPIVAFAEEPLELVDEAQSTSLGISAISDSDDSFEAIIGEAATFEEEEISDSESLALSDVADELDGYASEDEVDGYALVEDDEYSLGEEDGEDELALAANGAVTVSGYWLYRDSKSGDAHDYGYDDGIEIVGYKGSYDVTSLEIPSTIDGKTVTSFYALLSWDEESQKWVASKLCDTLVSITIPNTLKYIGPGFQAFSKLEQINIPSDSQLEVLANESFRDTALREFVMPASLKKINGSNAFSGCTQLERVVFNDVIEPFFEEGEETLTSYFPGTLAGTNYYNPFYYSTNIQFEVPSSCKNFKVIDGALISKDGTVFYSPSGGLESGTFAVPDGVKILANNDCF